MNYRQIKEIKKQLNLITRSIIRMRCNFINIQNGSFSNAYGLCRTRSPRYVEHQCFKLAILNSLYGIWWTCCECLHFIPSNSSIPLRLSVSFFVVVVVESFENDRNVSITCIANSHFHGNIVTNISNSQSNTISLCM